MSAAGLLWVWTAAARDGVFWPDEIYQSLEPAHRLAFGYGFLAWEYQVGARSWLFPAVLAAVLKLGAGAGLSQPASLLLLVKLFMVAVGLAGMLASMRLARALAGDRAAVLAGVLVAAFTPHVVFAGRCLSETATATALVWASSLLAGARPGGHRLSGALASFATLLRPGNGVAAAMLLGSQWITGRRREAYRYLTAALAIAAVGGALDWATWGAPFHSLWLYVRYNVMEGHAADYGTAPGWYYVQALWTSTGPAVLLLALGLASVPRAAYGFLAVALAHGVAHSLLAHKELRFLIPVMPLTLALAAVGLERRLSQLAARAGWLSPRLATGALAGAMAALMIGRASGLTYGEMGYHAPGMEEERVGAISGDFNRLLLRAHELPDLCGLAVAGAPIIWLGGYSYLHRDVPFFELDPPTPEGSPAANYVLVPSTWPPPSAASEIARSGTASLYRFDRTCGSPPRGFDRFEVPTGFQAPATSNR
jgi:phosphatidylinositol glycan class B